MTQLWPVRSEDRFRVKLDANDRVRLVAHGHDLAIGGACNYFEDVWHGRRGERVISTGFEWVRQFGEQPSPVVCDIAGFSVHERLRRPDCASVGFDYRLVAQADAESWCPWAQSCDDCERIS